MNHTEDFPCFRSDPLIRWQAIAAPLENPQPNAPPPLPGTRITFDPSATDAPHRSAEQRPVQPPPPIRHIGCAKFEPLAPRHIGIPLLSGSGLIDFRTEPTVPTLSRVFTIRSTSPDALTGLSATIAGTNPSDFRVTPNR